jgi:hypothetical protein
MNTPPLMTCGHAANGSSTVDGKPVPACVICHCLEVAADQPDLTGRMAKCTYTDCRSTKPSSFGLAFFEYRGPGSRYATDFCVCNFGKKAHLPEWQAVYRVEQQWFLKGRIQTTITRHERLADEATAQEWAAAMAEALVNGKQSDDTRVYSAELVSVKKSDPYRAGQKPITSYSCRGQFTPRGPSEVDAYYCGCKGWD